MKRFANVDKTDREIKMHEFFKESEIQVLQNSAFDFAGYLNEIDELFLPLNQNLAFSFNLPYSREQKHVLLFRK